MKKLREKHALHNKYRKSMMSSSEKGESLDDMKEDQSQRMKSKIGLLPMHRSNNLHSCSETISTASASFDGDNSGSGSSFSNSKRRNNLAYQPLGKLNEYEKSGHSHSQQLQESSSIPKYCRKIGTKTIPSQIHDSNYAKKSYPLQEETSGINPTFKTSTSFEQTKKEVIQFKEKEQSAKESMKHDCSTPPRTYQSHGYVHIVPTEAQLRWSQFHQKKRAAETKVRIEKLMQYPLFLQHVDGAKNGDGDKFIDEGPHSSKELKGYGNRYKDQFRLSQGRRALLRVSERRTIERRKHIHEHGYEMRPQDEYISDDDSSSQVIDSLAFDDFTDTFHTVDKPSTQIQKSLKLKNKSSKKRGRKFKRIGGMRSIVLTADEDEERMRRFEEAYNLMCTVKKNDDNIIKASKRWTRATNITSAISIDGRAYFDLQRSPTIKHEADPSKRFGNEIIRAKINGNKLADRGASWMKYTSKYDNTSPITSKFFGRSNPFHAHATSSSDTQCSDKEISPAKMKLMEIVDRFQLSDSHNVIVSEKFSRELDEDFVNNIKDSKRSNAPIPTKNDKNEGERNSFLRSKSMVSKNIEEQVKNADYNDEYHDHYEDNYEESAYTEESDPVYDQKIQQIALKMQSSNTVIDTDGQSDVSENCNSLQQARIGSLMMSPTIISKRLNQAIDAVKLGQWDQVGYLILANPWLAEMTDVTSNQFLLHKLCYYGAGTISETNDNNEPAPKKLNSDLIKASSTAIKKFDNLGNLPLHCACESGNKDMAVRLAKLFPEGASVRNEDGQLPLHLAILACANDMVVKAPLTLVSTMLALFPTALSIPDNDGNLPLHLAAAYLTGELGAEVVYLLLEEADKQGNKLRFPKSVKSLSDFDDTMTSINFEEIEDEEEQTVLSAKNNLGWNAVVTAIYRAAGYQILDELLARPGAEIVAYSSNDNGETMLHQSMLLEFCDPSSIISILKSFPDLVTFKDKNGALPIEIACLRELPSEIIFAITLIDLPIDPDDDDCDPREGFGGSWWYLCCDCDDSYYHIVREVLEICSEYNKKRALCFWKNKNDKSLISMATKRVKNVLLQSLRFNGRYEFIGQAIQTADGVKTFEALDFGTESEPREEGHKVKIHYYPHKEAFMRATRILKTVSLEEDFFPEINLFEENDDRSTNNNIERCIIVESPLVTLKSVSLSISKHEYSDSKRLQLVRKIKKVLRKLAYAIHSLHEKNIVHGHLSLDNFGKFEDGFWKLSGLIGCQSSRNPIYGSHTPEAVTFNKGIPQLLDTYPASPSIDIWAFGKVIYEALVGKPLIARDEKINVKADHEYLSIMGYWDENNLTQVVSVVESGNGSVAADLITHCLCRDPQHRPNMEEILSHPFWSVSSNE